jgi:hypothetical protein
MFYYAYHIQYQKVKKKKYQYIYRLFFQKYMPDVYHVNFKSNKFQMNYVFIVNVSL